jgi:hypothetical protein
MEILQHAARIILQPAARFLKKSPLAKEKLRASKEEEE